jgi:prolipoprotein diacylglyceryltransferase
MEVLSGRNHGKPVDMEYRLILDWMVSPRIQAFGKSWSAYQVCGCTGLALAILQSMILATRSGLPSWVILAIVICAVLTFFAVIMVTKIITGEEQIIYFHHEIAVMLITAGLLWLLRQPILPYLDVTILGIGIFLTCGRIGCLMVGCCHGRPHRWGVCYRQEHAEAGFAPYLVGVRLFPIQIVESLYVLAIVVVGILVFSGRSPGEALAWYVITYDIGRFCFEFMRGDTGRPYLYGFSEAQWISLFLMLAALGAELSGLLIFHEWHAAATVCIVGAMIVIAIRRRLRGEAKYKLFHPRQIEEVAEAVGSLSSLATRLTGFSEYTLAPDEIRIARTSVGVKISASRIEDDSGLIDHYAISHQSDVMSEEIARALGGLVLQLGHYSGPSQIVSHDTGIYHLLIRPQKTDAARSPIRE